MDGKIVIPRKILVAGAGLMLMVIIGVSVKVFDSQSQFKIISLPQKDDVYLIKEGREDHTLYSFLKVMWVNDGKVCLAQNVKVYESSTSELDGLDGFVSGVCFESTFEDLLEKYRLDEIQRVYRDWRPKTGFGQEIEIKDQLDREQIYSEDLSL